MGNALLIDIGSTYTKASAFNLKEEKIIAKSKYLTTTDKDITIGLSHALDHLERQGFKWDEAEYKLACSSAAGGLKMIAIGLVPELTVEAAKRAALGAGAKVQKVYSYFLTDEELKEIVSLQPDIILLVGGTDGGNTKTIIHNAKMIASSSLKMPIIVAGNKVAAPKVVSILKASGKDVRITENVMPQIERLNIFPARETIRQVFLEKIVNAKGLEKAAQFIDGVIMPTPTAVLKSVELLSQGIGYEEGWGDILAVDVGGATTDVHSAAKGEPVMTEVNLKGLEEPFIKRTVEGDLGMRCSAENLLGITDRDRILKSIKEMNSQWENFDVGIIWSNYVKYIDTVKKNIEYLPCNNEEQCYDAVMGKVCVNIAVKRHAGRIKTVYTSLGETLLQYGKDLTGVKTVIGTGGVIINHPFPSKILDGVNYNADEADALLPKMPHYYIDREYIMSAMGLLAEVEPLKALRILKKYLCKE